MIIYALLIQYRGWKDKDAGYCLMLLRAKLGIIRMFLIEHCLIDFADMVWIILRTFAFGMKIPIQIIVAI